MTELADRVVGLGDLPDSGSIRGSVITESDPVEFNWSARKRPTSEQQVESLGVLPAGPPAWARDRATQHESSIPRGSAGRYGKPDAFHRDECGQRPVVKA